MTQIISYPFRLMPQGRIATVEQNSDLATAEQLADLLLTRPGERVLVPTYGIVDPAFVGVNAADIEIAVAIFGPPVTIVSIEEQTINSQITEVRIGFA